MLISPRQLCKLLCELACRQHHAGMAVSFLSSELGCRELTLDNPAISQAEIAIVLTCSGSKLPTSKLHLKVFWFVFVFFFKFPFFWSCCCFAAAVKHKRETVLAVKTKKSMQNSRGVFGFDCFHCIYGALQQVPDGDS